MRLSMGSASQIDAVVGYHTRIGSVESRAPELLLTSTDTRPPPVSPEVLADLRRPLFVRPDGRAFRGAAARREAGAFVGEL